jgi:hypothetical protein
MHCLCKHKLYRIARSTTYSIKLVSNGVNLAFAVQSLLMENSPINTCLLHWEAGSRKQIACIRSAIADTHRIWVSNAVILSERPMGDLQRERLLRDMTEQ